MAAVYSGCSRLDGKRSCQLFKRQSGKSRDSTRTANTGEQGNEDFRHGNERHFEFSIPDRPIHSSLLPRFAHQSGDHSTNCSSLQRICSSFTRNIERVSNKSEPMEVCHSMRGTCWRMPFGDTAGRRWEELPCRHCTYKKEKPPFLKQIG